MKEAHVTKIEPFACKADIRRLVDAMRGEKTDRATHFEILIEAERL